MDVTKADAPAPTVVRELIGPALVGDSLGRIVRLSDGTMRSESWNGKAWVPGGVDIVELAKSPDVSVACLARFGCTPETDPTFWVNRGGPPNSPSAP